MNTDRLVTNAACAARAALKTAIAFCAEFANGDAAEYAVACELREEAVVAYGRAVNPAR
jgi:hypothetical protein